MTDQLKRFLNTRPNTNEIRKAQWLASRASDEQRLAEEWQSLQYQIRLGDVSLMSLLTPFITGGLASLAFESIRNKIKPKTRIRKRSGKGKS